MRIGIDVDEVLAGLLPAIISYHNETHDTSLTREDFKTFNFADVVRGWCRRSFRC